MALPLANTFEGGTDDTSISAANSGGDSGDAFDVVIIGTDTVGKFEASQAMHGGLSYEFSTGGTGASSFVQWSTSIGTYSTVYGRFYLRLSAAPGGNTSILSTISTSTARSRLQVLTTRKIRVLDASAGAVWTSTAVLSVDTWYRVEFYFLLHASAGEAHVKLFTGDSTSEDEDSTLFTGIAFGGSADRIRYGCVVNAVNFPQAWMDDIQANGTGFPGPAVSTVTGTAAAVLSLTATAAGVKTVSGSAAQALTLSATATGAKTVNGAAVTALMLTATGSGVRTVNGAAAAAVGMTASAAGARTVVGVSVAVLALGGTASGVRGTAGAASTTLIVTAAASGVRTTAGIAAAELTLIASAAGTKTVQGSAAASVSLTATAAGVVEGSAATVEGVAAASFPLTASAQGIRTVRGGASTGLAFTATAIGARVVYGTASGPASFTATAGGTRTVRGVGSAVLVLTAGGSGDLSVFAAAHRVSDTSVAGVITRAAPTSSVTRTGAVATVGRTA